jgi:hypothetical protein
MPTARVLGLTWLAARAGLACCLFVALLLMVGKASSESVHLRQGWNFITYEGTTKPVPLALSSIEDDYVAVFQLDLAQRRWLTHFSEAFHYEPTLFNLVHGSQYWVYVQRETELALDADAPPFYGVNSHLTGFDSDEKVERTVELMDEAGVGIVRTVFDWPSIEPERGVYRWERFDRVVERVEERGIATLGILDGSAPWATSAPSLDEPYWQKWPSKDLTAFGRYVYAVVERYDGDGFADAPGSPVVRYWEIWNEPNAAFFWRPQPDAEQYVRLLRYSYQVIKLAHPSAVVVLGGMAGNGVSYPPFAIAELDRNFLQQIYDHGGKSFFDVASIHLYPYTYELWRPDLMIALQDALDETRSVMATNGDDEKPIWVTEIGFSTALFPDGYETEPDAAIASWLGKVYRQLSGADALFWYMFEDEGTDEDPEGHFGLVGYDGAPKESYYEYRNMTGP